jgi:ribosome-associated translation inhibitor RaiA
MEEISFPVEFHSEVDNVNQKQLTALYDHAVERLHHLAQGRNDISSAIVNFKQPAHGKGTAYVYEVTIIVNTDMENSIATQTGANLSGVVDGVLDAIERQVRERRKRARNYKHRVAQRDVTIAMQDERLNQDIEQDAEFNAMHDDEVDENDLLDRM